MDTPTTPSRTRPPPLLTTHLPPTPQSGPRSLSNRRQTPTRYALVGRVPSPPLTPQTPSRLSSDASPPFIKSPTFDIAKGQLLGSGLWSNVYRIITLDEPVENGGTPPLTPQKTHNLPLPRIFAVKVANRPDALDVFAQEDQVLTHLHHRRDASRYVIPYLGFNSTMHALTFHAANAGDLEHFAADLDSTIDIFPELARQLTAGLAFLHASRVIHADIKPANILVDRLSTALSFRYCDFSASSIEDPDFLSAIPEPCSAVLPASPAPSRANSTRQATGGGTWIYMAPEQLNSNPTVSTPTRASDVYSLGMTLLTFLLGRNPYAAMQKNSNIFMLREAVKQGSPLRFARDDDETAQTLAELESSSEGVEALSFLDLALKKSKDDRIRSADWPCRLRIRE